MIVIKMFMWPGGDESKEREFGRMTIANDVRETNATAGSKGTYSSSIYGGVWGRSDLMKRIWKTGETTGFDRVNRGGWDLVYRILKNSIGYRN